MLHCFPGDNEVPTGGGSQEPSRVSVSELRFSENGLVPAIAQDADTGVVLMLAWMDQEAFDETVRTGRAVYFSRSRRKLWRKGEESGNTQQVVGIFLDCDSDTVLLKVRQSGPACHTGTQTCFCGREVTRPFVQ